jgi:isoleucyl-tRNA synthetase
MREQIRLWFYSQCFMAITLVGKQPYERVLTYEKVYDENGREMHKSWGNAIELDDALERMGADVMRWLYCSQPPSQPLRFGYGMAEEAKRRFLTFWNSVRFFVDYANIEGFRPAWPPAAPEGDLAPLDRWLVERVHAFVGACEAAYEAYDTVTVMREWEAFTDDLSNWYIRRSRRRFWDGKEEVAFAALWYALVQPLRALAPILPFVSDQLWRTLVLDGPESVHLAGWPDVPDPDEALLAEIAAVRRVVELGRQARSSSGIKLRQPLRRLVVEGASLDGHVEEVADELRVKHVELGSVEAVELRVKPNLPKLGPKLGRELGNVRAALAAGEFEELDGGRFRAAGYELEADEVLVERGGREGWAVASGDGVTVALDLALDDELVLEGEAYELIHRVNSLRKEQGLELTDRIVLTVPEVQGGTVTAHGDWIAGEVLATEIRIAGDELTLEKS